MKKFILLGMMCLCANVFAQASATDAPTEKQYRFRLSLTDKNGSEFSIDHPEKFLSQKALDRRQRQGIQVNETDLPIPSAYLKQIKGKGAKIHSLSKWANTVLVEVKDSLKGVALAELPFVSKSTCVWSTPAPKAPRGPQRSADYKRQDMVSKDPVELNEQKYGEAQNQAEMLNVTKLHDAGFRGQNLTIGVIDGGYMNADVIPAFDNIQILGTYNVVDPKSSVYDGQSHGTSVLSCMGMNKDNMMIGTAPSSKFWLIASEDAASETPAELDYWAAAVEYADSVGCDLVNSSLGYNDFDDPFADMKYWELDGKSNPGSIAAGMAADKGMICVISAGNSGAQAWKKITPPADADHILCVGATDSLGINTTFSSIGYSSDGRVKPDVCAQGGKSAVVGPTGKVGRANGTSFASPIMCGAVAALWSALPNLTAHQVIDLVRKNGSYVEHPNEVYGYGIPDLWKAYQSAR